MKRFWKRGGDRDLEARLRGARPEPTPEVTRAIADQVSPRRSGLIGGLGRIPVTAAGGLTAMVLIAVVALGGANYPIDAASKALNLENLKSISPDIKYGSNQPVNAQYGSRSDICVGGFVQLRVFTFEANLLVAQGLAVIGQCSDDAPVADLPRKDVCVGGYIGLRLSTSQANSLIAQGKAVAGQCP